MTMFPINLDISQLDVLLVGNGKQTVRRLGLLLESADSDRVTVFADQPSDLLVELAAHRLIRRLPQEQDIEQANVVMVVDLEEDQAARIANIARKHRVLVNVEDNKPYCDFFFSSLVRRGDLLLAVSTNGKSPTLAVKIKELLARAFSEEWIEKLSIIGKKRDQWKNEGLNYQQVKQVSEEFLEQEQWLGDAVCPRHRKK